MTNNQLYVFVVLVFLSLAWVIIKITEALTPDRRREAEGLKA